MNPEQRLIIQKNYSRLTEEILADDIADYLYSKSVIDHDDAQRVHVEKTDKDKASRLLDILLDKKGAFEPFLEEVKSQRPDLIPFLTDNVKEQTLKKDVKTLAELKELQDGQLLKAFLTVKVLEASAPMSYISKEKGVSQKLEVLIADTTDFADVIVYDLKKFSHFKVGEVVILSDFEKRLDGVLMVTKVSNVFSTKETVTVPQGVMEMAKKKADCTSVLNASLLPVQSTVTVKGKVTHASRTTTKRLRCNGEEVPFKKLKVKDSTGSILVELWRDTANTPAEKGSYVTIRNFTRTKSSNIYNKFQKPVLSNHSSKADVEIIQSFAEISDDEEDMYTEDASGLLQVGRIVGIDDLSIYRCCLIPQCNKKKVETDFRCPSCFEQYTIDSAGYAGIMKLIVKHENEMAIFKVFTDCIQQLLESLNLSTDLQKKDGTLEMLKSILPIRVKFTYKEDIISTITKFETY